ncbi:MAG: hypothetical protein KBF64_04410 [Anaerolineaceae bacterium]|nr:hypothetical protein [Anaerolineaceae bacterium]
MITDNKTRNERNIRRMIVILVVLILLAICLIGILVWQGLAKPAMSKTQESPELSQVVGTLKKGEDLFLVSGGGDISVLIPACAIDKKGTIALTPLGQYINEQIAPDSVWTWVRTADISYYTNTGKLIDSLDVKCPIQVCFTLTDEEWERYLKVPDDFEIQYLDHDSGKPAWITLMALTYHDSHQLCADHNQLGLFGLAIKNLTPDDQDGIYDPGQPEVLPTQPGLYEPSLSN